MEQRKGKNHEEAVQGKERPQDGGPDDERKNSGRMGKGRRKRLAERLRNG